MCLLSTPDVINTNVEFGSVKQKWLFVSEFDHCGRLECLYLLIRIYNTVKWYWILSLYAFCSPNIIFDWNKTLLCCCSVLNSWQDWFKLGKQNYFRECSYLNNCGVLTATYINLNINYKYRFGVVKFGDVLRVLLEGLKSCKVLQ